MRFKKWITREMIRELISIQGACDSCQAVTLGSRAVLGTSPVCEVGTGLSSVLGTVPRAPARS